MSTITTTPSTTPAVLVGDERVTYRLAADRSRTAYRRKHGAATLQTIAERRAWTLAHAVPMAAAAERGGMNAVRKMHTARVERLVTMTDPSRIGGAATGAFLDTIAHEAMHSRARLEALAPVRKTAPRKPAKRANSAVAAEKLAGPAAKISPVVDVPETPDTTPDTVPAPMPKMTRAAAKQTRREIAAAMRAEGLRPDGDAWRERCAAAGLVVPAEVSA